MFSGSVVACPAALVLVPLGPRGVRAIGGSVRRGRRGSGAAVAPTAGGSTGLHAVSSDCRQVNTQACWREHRSSEFWFLLRNSTVSSKMSMWCERNLTPD